MNCVKRFLLTCLLAFAPALGFAQTLVNCAPATPCTMSGPAGTGTGDPAWLAFGKVNTNFLQTYAGVGNVTYAAGNTGTAPVPNLTNGAVQTWTQNSNVVWDAPINVPAVGQRLVLIVTQNGTGGYSTAWNAIFKNVPPTPAASVANSKAVYVFAWSGTYWLVLDNYTNTPFPYGAVGDDVANDTAAVQACAASALCILPIGYTFKITGIVDVPANSLFIGEDFGSSIIDASNVPGPAIRVGTTTSPPSSWYQNVTIGNFQIAGSAKIGLAASAPLSTIANIRATGAFSLQAFSFDVTFGSVLLNLNTSNGGNLGSTLTFTGSVGAATSGTISSGTNPGNGTYIMIFANGEIRAVTISGSAASWTAALRAGTISTVAYGGGFFFGGGFNSNACNMLYTGGGATHAFDFIFDDSNSTGNSTASTFNGLTAQNGQVGAFFGSNHFSHTINGFYSENVVTPIVLGIATDFNRRARGHTFNSPQLSSPLASHPQYTNRVALIDYNNAHGITINSPSFYPGDTYDSWVPKLVFTGGGSPTSNAYGYLIINAAGVPKAAVLLYGGTGYGSNPTVTVTGGTGGSGTTVTAVQSGGVVTSLTLVGPGSGWTQVLPLPIIYTIASNCSINNPYLEATVNQKWPLYPMIARSSTANTGAGIAIFDDNTWVGANQDGGYYDGAAATTIVSKTSGNNYHHVATYMNDAASPVPTYSPNSAGTNYFIPTVMP